MPVVTLLHVVYVNAIKNNRYQASAASAACYHLQVSSLGARLKQAEKDAALYNSREALFNKSNTDYSEVKKLWETFEPYQQFWSIAASWKVEIRLP